MPNPLTFHSLSGPEAPVRGRASASHDGKPPRLMLVTAAGTLREVPLDRADLLRIIEQAAVALRRMGFS